MYSYCGSCQRESPAKRGTHDRLREAHPANNWEKFVEVLIVGTFTVLITTALGLVYLHRSGIL